MTNVLHQWILHDRRENKQTEHVKNVWAYFLFLIKGEFRILQGKFINNILFQIFKFY